jgi:hypothetical protein
MKQLLVAQYGGESIAGATKAPRVWRSTQRLNENEKQMIKER